MLFNIQDFPDRGANPKGGVNLLFGKLFAEDFMKLKEIERRGALVPNAPFDPPMNSIPLDLNVQIFNLDFI